MSETTPSFETWLGCHVTEALSRAERYAGQTVVLLGVNPFDPGDLRTLLPPACDVFEEEIPDSPDVVVLGQSCPNEGDLDDALDAATENTRFLPQEGFIDEVLFGFDWWLGCVTLLDGACAYYPALAYIRARAGENQFVWPSAIAVPVSEPVGADYGDWQGESRLHHLGYNVSVNLSRDARWSVLDRIISNGELPLSEVADTIAGHCRARRRQHGGEEKYSRALGEWEHDLQRLQASFHRSPGNRFHWPSTS